MKKNMLIMVGLVVLFVSFNGCRPREKEGFVPGRDYVKDNLDPNTKGALIPESIAKDAIEEYYNNYYNPPQGSPSIKFKDYFPEYEVFSIHELLTFIFGNKPNEIPAYLVVRHGAFINSEVPGQKILKTLFYMTDSNHNPIKSLSPNPKILFFEELRRCPPDNNCNSVENIREFWWPVEAPPIEVPEEEKEEEDIKE